MIRLARKCFPHLARVNNTKAGAIGLNVMSLYDARLNYFFLRLQGIPEEEANRELDKPRS